VKESESLRAKKETVTFHAQCIIQWAKGGERRRTCEPALLTRWRGQRCWLRGALSKPLAVSKKQRGKVILESANLAKLNSKSPKGSFGSRRIGGLLTGANPTPLSGCMVDKRTGALTNQIFGFKHVFSAFSALILSNNSPTQRYGKYSR
jgi:hypothetical protein